jgi:hypothetical protein
VNLIYCGIDENLLDRNEINLPVNNINGIVKYVAEIIIIIHFPQISMQT